MNVDKLGSQIKENCHISDSGYWGYLSLCNMLLRLRELYFHENNLRPWDKIDKTVVGDWISDREKLWEQLEEKSLADISIDGKYFDPFEADSINESLADSSYYYGSGYGLLKKPNFFLAELVEKQQYGDYDVYILGRELVRDMLPGVAMHQSGKIFIRMEIFENFLYQKFLESRKDIRPDSLGHAFQYYRIPVDGTLENHSEVFSGLAKKLVPVLLWHEEGEAAESSDEWLEILEMADDKLTELRLRAVKDVIADNSDIGTVAKITESGDRGLLYFHLSFMDEMKKHVFPFLHCSLKDFSWSKIGENREKMYNRAAGIRGEILDEFARSRDIGKIREVLKKHFP